jgi:uncharacterized sulfatase
MVFTVLISSCQRQPERPNIVFVMMDDFGYGQFAAHNDTLETGDFDSLLVAHEKRINDYDPALALDFSRKATPTLKRLAGEGVLFTNAYAASNLCSPSRIAIATGIHQNRLGVYRNVDSEARGLDPGSHLAGYLQKAGYRTVHIGKWHIGKWNAELVKQLNREYGLPETTTPGELRQSRQDLYAELVENGYPGSITDSQHPLNNGFDYYFGYNMWQSPFYGATNVWENFEHAGVVDNYNTDVFTDKAIQCMDSSLQSGKPFYIQLFFHAVHGPLEPKAPDKYYNRFDSESFVLNNFYAHVFGVDESVKRICEYLEDKGIAGNTMIVFTSDNGGAVGGRSTLPGNAPFTGHKGMHRLGGIKVPLVFYWPAGIREPMESNHLVSTMDIIPSCLDAAGIELPAGLDGRSLVPIISGENDDPIHDYLIWSGIHARAFGFMNSYSLLPPLKAREKAPYAWVVIKDGWMQRYIDRIPPGVYEDHAGGSDPTLKLFRISEDLQESTDLLDEQTDVYSELEAIWKANAVHYPPPVNRGRDKWSEIVPEDNPFLKAGN